MTRGGYAQYYSDSGILFYSIGNGNDGFGLISFRVVLTAEDN